MKKAIERLEKMRNSLYREFCVPCKDKEAKCSVCKAAQTEEKLLDALRILRSI